MKIQITSQGTINIEFDQKESESMFNYLSPHYMKTHQQIEVQGEFIFESDKPQEFWSTDDYDQKGLKDSSRIFLSECSKVFEKDRWYLASHHKLEDIIWRNSIASPTTTLKTLAKRGIVELQFNKSKLTMFKFL